MKITSITVKRLKTGPGYSNVAHEATALLEENDDPEKVRHALDLQVQAWNEEKSVLQLEQEKADAVFNVTDLKREQTRLTGEVASLRSRIAEISKTPLEKLMDDGVPF